MVRVTREGLLRHGEMMSKGKRRPFLDALDRLYGGSTRLAGSLASSLSTEPIWQTKKAQIRIFGFHVAPEETHLTCMAVCDTMNMIALGSGHTEGNLYFVKPSSTTGQWETLHRVAVQAPIHSLDWFGEHLLVGTVEGTARLYRVPSCWEEGDGWRVIRVAEYITQLPKEVVLPSFRVFNSHVKAAQFAVHDAGDNNSESGMRVPFLTTLANQVAHWSCLEDKQSTGILSVGEVPLHSAHWSPHAPYSLVVTGGDDGSLRVLDTRASHVVWHADHAHQRPVRDAKFNPFIPYWLASAGEDGVVNLWDIRSCKHEPVGKVDGNAGVVDWSNTRPEVLASAISDGTFSLWSLDEKDIPWWDSLERTACSTSLTNTTVWNTNVIAPWAVDKYVWQKTDPDDTCEPDTMLLVGASALASCGPDASSGQGPFIQVCASKKMPSTYYCVTRQGRLVSYTVHTRMASHHRYKQAENPLAYQIEEEIYHRHVDDAELHLKELRKETARDGNHQQRIQDLEDALTVPQPISPDTWAIDSLPDKKNRRVSRRLWNEDDLWDLAIRTFKHDLAYWGQRLPPITAPHLHLPLDIKSFEAQAWPETLVLKKNPSLRPFPAIHTNPEPKQEKDSEDQSRTPTSAVTEPSSETPQDPKPFSDVARSRSAGAAYTEWTQSPSPHRSSRFSLRRVFSRGHVKEESEQEETSDLPSLQPRLSRKRTGFFRSHPK